MSHRDGEGKMDPWDAEEADDDSTDLPDDTPMVIGLARAGETLLAEFGPLVSTDYLPGKTQFRDTLCERFGLSQLQAEELCDELERTAILRFVQSVEGSGWHIHLEADGRSLAG
jgi:hypothetical protein